MSVSETRRRIGFWAASVSLGLVLIGSGAVVTLFPPSSATTRIWMALPLFAAIAGMLFSVKSWAGPLWACTGAMFGFAVLGAWSIGGFYVPAAWAMLAASIVHPADTSVPLGWRGVRALLWTLAGASVLGVFSLALDWWSTSVTDYTWTTATGFGHVHEAHIVTHAPITVWAAWFFVGVCTVLITSYWVARDRRHQD